LMTVNRLCSSGLQAVMEVVNQIAANQIDIGIGGGVESMSSYNMQDGLAPDKLSDSIFECEGARNCLIPMGLTSENVVEKYGLKREDLDKFALASHQKAAHAQKEGWTKDEIVEVKTVLKDKDGKVKEVVISQDDGIRKDASIQMLSKLKPAFKKDGVTTAGNSSQVTDGAAAVLVCRRSKAKELGLTPIARFISYAVAGCPPEIMGIGPALAIPQVLKKCGLAIKDIDVFEINEAFASQATYCVNTLQIPHEKVNPRGGAIALGHPLGMTGARQFATLLSELKRTNKKMGLISMCIGTGMGAACVVERE
jgi:acetyl-CoA acyltransferase 1